MEVVIMAYAESLKFVTLEDIFGGQYEFNYVIYNPYLSKLRNEEILKKVTKNEFNVILSDDEVDELTAFDRHHLFDFIDAYLTCLRKHGKTPTRTKMSY
jgi:hypothetical protein